MFGFCEKNRLSHDGCWCRRVVKRSSEQKNDERRSSITDILGGKKVRQSMTNFEELRRSKPIVRLAPPFVHRSLIGRLPVRTSYRAGLLYAAYARVPTYLSIRKLMPYSQTTTDRLNCARTESVGHEGLRSEETNRDR
jgi:hypothetical protein